ncbi:MAG: BON domain-containing protein [Polyangiaceae bacterium]
MKCFISTGFIALALVACGASNVQEAQAPRPTTTTNGTAPVTTPHNDGSTNLNMHLPPSEPEPNSQSGTTPLSTTSQGGGVTGGPLADSTKMAEPNNSSEMTGGGATTAGALGTSPGTAASTSSTEDDRKLTTRIHKALDGNASLSVDAKNVTVQAAGGNVILSGVVKSAREKSLVEAAAAKIAGTMHVSNQLVVGK